MAQDGGIEESATSAPSLNGFQKQDNPPVEKKKIDVTSGKISTTMIVTRDAKSLTAATSTGPAGKSRPPVVFSDERRDERVHKATPGSTGLKAQARAPPSPHGSIDGHRTPQNRMDFFDWREEENDPATMETPGVKLHQGTSSPQRQLESERQPNQPHYRDRAESEGETSLLFAHSFDTLSENGNLGDNTQSLEASYSFLASPISQSNLSVHSPIKEESDRAEIGLPDLEHTASDCSMLDMSPIKATGHPASTTGVDNPYPGMQNPRPPNYATQKRSSLRGRVGTRDETEVQRPPPPPTENEVRGPPISGYRYGYHSRQRDLRQGKEYQEVSNPFYVIRSCRKAFEFCTYLLPCLRDVNVVSVNLNRYGHIRRYQGHPSAMDSDSMDLVIAKRRVESAICAFGGTLRSAQPAHASSIFRRRDGRVSKPQYENNASQRYRITNEGRISWDVEADPHVELDRRRRSDDNSDSTEARGSSANGGSLHVIVDDSSGGSKRPRLESSSSSFDNNTEAPKLKYRCKLCGQPKQNHNCTFRQSLQRNIGVQVYRAVNAYTACEPGSLAPTLSKMNNFVSYDSTQGTPSEENAYPQTSESHHYPSTVTPQSMREGGGVMVHSPQSSLSTHSQEMSPDSSGLHPKDGRFHVHYSHHTSIRRADRRRPNAPVSVRYGQNFHHAAFAPSVSLRPEHYRAVTPFRGEAASTSASMRCGDYQYPPVPLTFEERKRMSDTLFYFSKEIPNMTSGCAGVLCEAREKGDWDQAVAELLTQIIVGLYCGEGDTQLDGLHQYLLALGISC